LKRRPGGVNGSSLAPDVALRRDEDKAGGANPRRPPATQSLRLTSIAAGILDVGLIRVLSCQVAGALRENALSVVLDTFESAPLPINLVHKGQAPLSLKLKLRAFLDFMTPRLRAHISGELTDVIEVTSA
jgi:hypothetical protein